MKTCRRFCDEEIEVIKQHYPDIKTIAALLPSRTARAIKSKAGLLNLATPRSPEWTLEELKTLSALHPDFDAIKRALPGRSRSAISKRITSLNIGRSVTKWSDEKTAVLARISELLTDREAGKLLNVSLKAVAMRRYKMGLTKVQAAPSREIELPIVGDIRTEATRRGITLGKITKPLGCQRLGPSLSAKRVSWTSAARVVAALGGELEVEWSD